MLKEMASKGLLCLYAKIKATTLILWRLKIFSEKKIKLAMHEFWEGKRLLFLYLLTKTTFCA
ncbi:hypothetical protein AP285_22770 [Limnospira platensis YZ]|nr:hypothetical protein AP285_22770 [Arthrospira platensis YZ]